jgi:uridine nucleosidase
MRGAVGGGFPDAKNGTIDGSLEKEANERFGNETYWTKFNFYCKGLEYYRLWMRLKKNSGDPEAARSIFSILVLAAKTTHITLGLIHLCLATASVRGKWLKVEIRVKHHQIYEW